MSGLCNTVCRCSQTFLSSHFPALIFNADSTVESEYVFIEVYLSVGLIELDGLYSNIIISFQSRLRFTEEGCSCSPPLNAILIGCVRYERLRLNYIKLQRQ